MMKVAALPHYLLLAGFEKGQNKRKGEGQIGGEKS